MAATDDTGAGKACSRCGSWKPLGAFYADRRRSDGRRAVCAPCFKKATPWVTGSPKDVERQRKRRAARAAGMEARRQARAAAAAALALARSVRAVMRWQSTSDAHAHARARGLRSAAEYRQRYAADPQFAVHERVRTALRKKAKRYPKLDDLMRDALNRGGRSNVVVRVLGYDIAQLRAHLEAQFVDGMNWKAFHEGRIHIDHREPQSAFDLMDEQQVRQCWALSNLQPLWAADNIAKGARRHEGGRRGA